MHRQGFDLQLTQYDERGWRATFYTTGMERCPLASGARAAVGLACFPVQAPHQRTVAISSASQAFTGSGRARRRRVSCQESDVDRNAVAPKLDSRYGLR